MKLRGFTLAETLIALGIIGIIAALTLPTLITTISNVVTENQKAVFQRKLSKGADLLNIDNGIGPYYSDTESFVKRLSEHLKIVTICGKDNLKNCLTYDTIQQNGTEPFNVEDITTDTFTGLAENKEYLDAAGFVLGDGTPMILTYQKDCPVSDPDEVKYSGSKKNAISNHTSCIAGFYDLNGVKGPNKFGKDIVPFNGVSGLKNTWISFAGFKVTTPKVPNPIKTADYCEQNGNNWTLKSDYRTNYNINSCCTNSGCKTTGDYWAGAMIECKDIGGHLPTESQLTTIASYLYDDGNLASYSIRINKSKLGPLAGFDLESGGSIYLWGTRDSGTDYYRRHFARNYTDDDYMDVRKQSYLMALCIKGD
ncbi:prepilin-type N-terminal cleavage/methylation domain-containing protein [bacterium]|nr:prepilin-type N-terminal cleavage/methylation domain-containing protein [bacterium]